KNLARLAVHQRGSPHNLSSKNFADGLVSQAHAEHWYGFMKVLNDVLGNPGVRRDTRSRRNHDMRWVLPFDFFQCDFVITEDPQLGAQLAQILNEVVGEGVVVIDHHDHSSNPPFARLIALMSARDLFTVSVYSFSGTESATMPAPAWM